MTKVPPLTRAVSLEDSLLVVSALGSWGCVRKCNVHGTVEGDAMKIRSLTIEMNLCSMGKSIWQRALLMVMMTEKLLAKFFPSRRLDALWWGRRTASSSGDPHSGHGAQPQGQSLNVAEGRQVHDIYYRLWELKRVLGRE